MKPDDREAYVRYRLSQANEALETAQILIDHQRWNAAVNRLYYAVYYATSGLLAKHAINAKSHAGVKTQFLLHFVKTEKISYDLGKTYSDLFDWRQKGDYGDFFDFQAADLENILPPTKVLVKAITTEAGLDEST
ncbi:MAG: HEPN domain-containing protein [Bacteroidota bacterium]